jgi:hypothetical protein
MKLQITAAKIFGFEAEIVRRNQLHAQHGLIKARRLFEIFGSDRQVIKAEDFHGCTPRRWRHRLFYHLINNAIGKRMQAK